MSQDLVISTDKHRFGFRTVGVLVRNGNILVQREKNGDQYALPGGAVQMLENSEDAIIREFKEETGADIEIKRLLWTEENFWAYKGRRHHGLAFYYLVELCCEDAIPEDADFLPQLDGEDVEFGWLPLKELKKITIYPSFLKDEIDRLDGCIKHFIIEE